MLRTLLLLLFLFIAGPLHASTVSEQDWQFAGDGLLTYDSATNLEWLDLSVTVGIAYLDVEEAAMPGYWLQGFRTASADEVWSMMSNAGLPMVPLPARTDFSGASLEQLADFLALAWDGFDGSGYAMTNELFYEDQRAAGMSAHPGSDSGWVHFQNGWDASAGSSVLSTWLVRSAAPVPLPLPALLLGSALCTLLFPRHLRGLGN